MIIHSIKWNGRVMDITHIGQKTGTKYVANEAKVSQYGDVRVEKIEEINLTTYEIHYNEYGEKSVLRVFNPIEVLFKQQSNENT